jgi:hypothetical protein
VSNWEAHLSRCQHLVEWEQGWQGQGQLLGEAEGVEWTLAWEAKKKHLLLSEQQNDQCKGPVEREGVRCVPEGPRRELNHGPSRSLPTLGLGNLP